jgi:hypothetical protein
MMKSLLDQKNAVGESMKRCGLWSQNLNFEEWELLEELVRFLTKFDHLTKLVSNNNAGLSLMSLIRDAIEAAIEPSEDFTDSPSIVQLKSLISQKVNSRFPTSRTENICILLDPSSKNCSGLKRDKKVTLLEGAILDLPKEKSSSPSESDHTTTALSMKQILLANRKRKLDMDSQRKECEEIARYISHEVPVESQYCNNPLLFWKTYSTEYPVLSKLARMYLCASASSVPVECMFSTTGLILNGKRSSIAPFRLNYLSFIHDNYPVLFK